MTDTDQTPVQGTPAVQYYALPKEVVQEVLNHLASNPVAALYAKVNQAVLIVQTPEAPKDTAPSAN